MVALKTGHLRAVQTLQNRQSGERSSGDWTHLQLQLQRLQHFTFQNVQVEVQCLVARGSVVLRSIRTAVETLYISKKHLLQGLD